jgi:hypothetical protein
VKSSQFSRGNCDDFTFYTGNAVTIYLRKGQFITVLLTPNEIQQMEAMIPDDLSLN